MTKDLEKFAGILMLDTQFPRFKGDIGNPETFAFPVRLLKVDKAFPEAIVKNDPEHMFPAFLKAARKLEAEGAALITTSCGFLCLFQKRLQAALSVPVLTSSLFMWNEINQALPKGRTTGILTISKSSLGKAHLSAASIPPDAPLGSTEDGTHFTNAILSNRKTLDAKLAENELVEAAIKLQKQHPELGAVLLECTNMPPYASAITMATGLPVHSLNGGIRNLWEKVTGG